MKSKECRYSTPFYNFPEYKRNILVKNNINIKRSQNKNNITVLST